MFLFQIIHFICIVFSLLWKQNYEHNKIRKFIQSRALCSYASFLVESQKYRAHFTLKFNSKNLLRLISFSQFISDSHHMICKRNFALNCLTTHIHLLSTSLLTYTHIHNLTNIIGFWFPFINLVWLLNEHWAGVSSDLNPETETV